MLKKYDINNIRLVNLQVEDKGKIFVDDKELIINKSGELAFKDDLVSGGLQVLEDRIYSPRERIIFDAVIWEAVNETQGLDPTSGDITQKEISEILATSGNWKRLYGILTENEEPSDEIFYNPVLHVLEEKEYKVGEKIVYNNIIWEAINDTMGFFTWDYGDDIDLITNMLIDSGDWIEFYKISEPVSNKSNVEIVSDAINFQKPRNKISELDPLTFKLTGRKFLSIQGVFMNTAKLRKSDFTIHYNEDGTYVDYITITSIHKSLEALLLTDEDNYVIIEGESDRSDVYTQLRVSGSNNVEFHLPIPTNSNYLIDWGDGTVNRNPIKVATANSMTVKIYGIIDDFNMNYARDFSVTHRYVIEKWGGIVINNPNMLNNTNVLTSVTDTEGPIIDLKRLDGLFSNILLFTTMNGLDKWDLSGVESVSRMFEGCARLANMANIQAVGDNLGNVADLSFMFSKCTAFNLNISTWVLPQTKDISGIVSFCTKFTHNLENIVAPQIEKMDYLFQGLNLTLYTHDLTQYDYTKTNSLKGLFANTTFNGDITNWDLSAIENIDEMFKDNTAFNQNVSGWDISNIKTLNRVFSGATAFNQDLSTWDISHIESLSGLFEKSAITFDLNAWNMSNVKDISYLISGLNYTHDITTWDTSNVENMSGLLMNSTYSLPLTNLNISKVKNMSYMFSGTKVFNHSLIDWDISNVENISYMFKDNKVYTQSLNEWDVSNVINMDGVFSGSIYNEPLSNWDVRKVTTMVSIFESSSFNQPLETWVFNDLKDLGSAFKNNVVFNQNINTWNVSNVINFKEVFRGATTYDQPLDMWDTGRGKDFSSMFSNATAFNRPLETWNLSRATNLGGMFGYTTNFNQNINTWDVSNVETFIGMFSNATSFNEPLYNWNTSKCRNFSTMFLNATAFNQDISEWDLSNAVDVYNMFEKATSFNQPVNKWDMSNVSSLTGMFKGATSFNQPINNWYTPKVESYYELFANATSFKQDVSNLTFKSTLINPYLNTNTFSSIISGIPDYPPNLLSKFYIGIDNSGVVLRNKSISLGTMKYDSSGVTARQNLINKGYIITDGGLA